jgi:hypothetical protein
MTGPKLKEIERLLQAGSGEGEPSSAAIVNDALIGLALEPLSDDDAREFDVDTPYAALAAHACRALAHPFFAGWAAAELEEGRDPRARLLTALRFAASSRARSLAELSRFRSDGEGREELSRALLTGLGVAPEGESPKLAKDRFAAVDSVERARVLARAKAAEDRARELREEMARREAEEAASKMSRE